MTNLVVRLRDYVNNTDDVPLRMEAANQIERLLKAGDEVAHQSVHTPLHERWWQARGGHDKCTVCAPIEDGLQSTRPE